MLGILLMLISGGPDYGGFPCFPHLSIPRKISPKGKVLIRPNTGKYESQGNLEQIAEREHPHAWLCEFCPKKQVPTADFAWVPRPSFGHEDCAEMQVS